MAKKVERYTVGNITIERRLPKLLPLDPPFVRVVINGWLKSGAYWTTLDDMAERAAKLAGEPIRSLEIVCI